MNDTKMISKKKKIRNRDKENLKMMIKKNPSLKKLVDKFDLQLTKIEK